MIVAAGRPPASRMGLRIMDFDSAAELDFRQEARGCLHLAEAETQPEMKTVLMGMALGWLTLARDTAPRDAAHNEAEDDEAEDDEADMPEEIDEDIRIVPDA